MALFTYLTDRTTDTELLVNMGQVERIEPRSRGAALYYVNRRHPVRVSESIKEIAKRLGARKSVPARRRWRR